MVLNLCIQSRGINRLSSTNLIAGRLKTVILLLVSSSWLFYMLFVAMSVFDKSNFNGSNTFGTMKISSRQG